MLPHNNFRLVTLGRPTLLGAAGEEDASLAKRRFKLALLAVLATARRPLTRDVLLEMFWGEQDEARARHSLSNALSSLRRALGQRAITTRDADVALADVPLDVDALELAEAAQARDAARVVELYGGPFLDGVHVDESPAFDQWVFRERRRLEAIFLDACARQCETLARARRWSDCRALAARWLDTEPLSANAALFLINAIKATGTRAALADALDEYERLRTRLDREFDLQPEQCVRELAARLREQMASMDPEPAGEPAPEPIRAVATPATPATTPALAAAAAAPAHGTIAQQDLTPARARGSRWRVASVGLTGALALLLAARGVPGSGGAAVTGSVHKPVIAVLDMGVRSNDSSVAWLGEGLPQMIARKLGHTAAVDVVDPTRARGVVARRGGSNHEPLDDAAARDVARRVGATLVAHGAISQDGSNLVLEVTVRDVESGNLVRTDVLTGGNALVLASEAAARILGAANVIVPGPHMTGLETSSLEAYQHYMRALEAGRVGHGTEHKRQIDAAVALDPGFIAVVRARLQIAVVESDTAVGRRLRETLGRHADRATKFDRLEQEASDAFYAGERERSEALARSLLRSYPRDPRAYRLLEDFLASHGEIEQAEAVAIQGLALDSLAMEAGTGPCAVCNGFYDVVRFRWIRGDFRGAAEWARRWIRTQPDEATAWAALAWTLAYTQRPDSAVPLMQRAVSLSGADVWASGELVRLLLVARQYDAADSAITVMESSADRDWGATAFDLRSLLNRERGRYRASNEVVERFRSEVPTSAGFAGMIHADNQRILGQYASAARGYEVPSHPAADRNLQLPVPSASARAFCWHHALAADVYAETGDTIMLRAMADTLERGCVRSPYGRDWRLHHHVRGLVAMRAGRYAEAERELRKAIWSPVEGWSRTTVHLADAQRALGRPDDAIATLRTAYSTRLNAMGRYVPISELDYRMAQAFAQAGERDSARTYAAYVRSAWRDADPEIQRLLERLP